MTDPWDEAATRLDAIAAGLERGAERCRTAARRFRERVPPRAATHAFAAHGHLRRAGAALDREAEIVAGKAEPDPLDIAAL